ncbi:MAG: AbrB/MazE/SpoVT family DNA-binding domain-containing protein [Gallionellaceae bacterium]|nr:AbrB/MazE/SpoVT family DNA-binding domain-containing protein [Gallionellaceae bacterium]
MSAVTVSVKGQVVLPAEIRRKLGIVGGSQLEVVASEGGVLLRPLKGKASRVEDGVGLVPNPVGPVPLDEMDGGRILARYKGKGL